MDNYSDSFKALIGLVATCIILVPVWFAYKKYLISRQNRYVEKMTQIIFKMYQNLISTNFDLNPISPNDFKSLDLNFYDNEYSKLSASNFKLIGDFEESNFRQKFPSANCFLRIMTSEDGKVKAYIYHLNFQKKDFKTIEFVTEFTNGTVLITSNCILNFKVEYPKEIIFELLITDSAEKLLGFHLTKLNKNESAEKFDYIKCNNLYEILEQNKRMQLKINSFRQHIKKEDVIKELIRFGTGLGFHNRDTVLSIIADNLLELNSQENSK